MNVHALPTVTFNNKTRPLDARIAAITVSDRNFSNPFNNTAIPPPQTQTLGVQQVHQKATAALRPLLEGVRTADDLLHDLNDIR